MLERFRLKAIVARNAKHAWGVLLPVTSRVSPKMFAKVAGSMSPEDFARIIAETPDSRLEAAMQSKMRGVVLDEVIRRMETEFKPERAQDLDAVIQFEITGRPDGGSDLFQLTVRNGTCVTSKTITEDPKVKIVLDAVIFLKLVTGIEGGTDLYIGGKLKIDGAVMLGTRITSMFNVPDATPKSRGLRPVAQTTA